PGKARPAGGFGPRPLAVRLLRPPRPVKACGPNFRSLRRLRKFDRRARESEEGSLGRQHVSLLDETVPYDGGGGAIDFVPAWYSTSFWVIANGCGTKPKTWISPDESVVVDTYTGGADGTEVALCTIVNGRHAWNSGTALSVRDLMWEFFATH